MVFFDNDNRNNEQQLRAGKVSATASTSGG